jgi:hypothetical protein
MIVTPIVSRSASISDILGRSCLGSLQNVLREFLHPLFVQLAFFNRSTAETY